MKNLNRRKNARRTQGDIPRLRPADVTTVSCSIPTVPRSYTFMQKDFGTTQYPIIGSSTVPVASYYVFQLSSLANNASFTGLFDQYKVDAIQFRVRPRSSMATINAGVYAPPLYLVIDYDNTTALPNVATALQYTSCAVVESYQSASRTFKPHVAVAAYSGAFTAYKNELADWIDCASNTVLHYGVKYYLPVCPATALPEWDVDVDVYLSFRNII